VCVCSLPLRFWVGVVTRPGCLFDVHNLPAVDACLSVIAQTLMDSCATHPQRLSKVCLSVRPSVCLSQVQLMLPNFRVKTRV